MGQCLHCQKELPPRSTKPRVYCSRACRQADYRARESARDNAASTAQATRIAELEAEIARLHELEVEIARLHERLNIEYRFRMDTAARNFKGWLRRQTTHPQGSFAQRFLADQSLPPQGSRALYEAQMRRLHYSEDDLHQFTEFWKAMLLQA